MSEAIDLRLGRWQEALADVGEVSAIITDPPYSERTHAGRRVHSDNAPKFTRRSGTGGGIRKPGIDYAAIDAVAVDNFVARWAEAQPRWWVVFGDHVSSQWWRASLALAGYYVFGPVIWCKPDAAPRFSGDGPAMSTEIITVARSRSGCRGAGSLPGHYICPAASVRGPGCAEIVPGSKPLALMRALVRDYSRPGDLICDPFAGSGTTLLAAAIEGRRAVGSEMDPKTHALAARRLAAGYTPGLFAPAAELVRQRQEPMFGAK